MGSSYSKWIAICSLYACTIAVRAEQVASEAKAGRLEVQNEVADAGEIVRGKEATGTFVLKNVGEGLLKVLNVKPGCGCTVASFDESIAPGQTGKVTAAVKTENFRGNIEKVVTVTTNDPQNPTVVLKIRANVVGSATLLPRAGFVFPTAPDWDYAGKLVIRKDPSEKGELHVTNVTTSAPWVIAKVRKVEKEEAFGGGIPQAMPGDYVLDVSIGEDAPKTRAPQTVTFKTGLPREPEMSVPVSAVLDKPMRVNPMRIYLAPTEPGKELTGTVLAIVRPGLGDKPLEATVSPDAFAVKLEPDGKRRYKATVTFKPDSGSAPTAGTVVLKVGEESVTVPVHVGDVRVGEAKPVSAVK